jgi:hypothetical protein
MHGIANPKSRWFESSPVLQFRKCGRVVYGSGLENQRIERYREFESHRFRQIGILNSVGRVLRLHRRCRRFEPVRMYHKCSIKFKLFCRIDQHLIQRELTCGSGVEALLIIALCRSVQVLHGVVSSNHTNIYSRIVKWYNGRLISDYYKFNSCSGYQFLKGQVS